jgi:hypothetical protein
MTNSKRENPDTSFVSEIVSSWDAVLHGHADQKQTGDALRSAAFAVLGTFLACKGLSRASHLLGDAEREGGILSRLERSGAAANLSDVGPPNSSSFFTFKPFRSEIWTHDPDLLRESFLNDLRFQKAQNGSALGQTIKRDQKLSSAFGRRLKGEFVGQATYGIGPLDIPLATNHLATCGALVVHDVEANLQYLAHVDAGVTSKQINDSLKVFDLGRTNSYFLKGPVDSFTEQVVIDAYRNSGVLERLKFVKPVGNQFQGLISYKGKLFKMTRDIEKWPKFKIPHGDEQAFWAASKKVEDELAPKAN